MITRFFLLFFGKEQIRVLWMYQGRLSKVKHGLDKMNFYREKGKRLGKIYLINQIMHPYFTNTNLKGQFCRYIQIILYMQRDNTV